MSAPAFIAGDWGTSNLRLRLCAADGSALDSREGPGAADSRGRFAAVFDELTAAWRATAPLPALLCGMAGSTFGWVEAPYLPCPEEVDNAADALVSARADVHIVPGMRCVNPLGAPDVMRGEETQLLGALALRPELAHGRHLVCLPGTHTKWVALHDGTVIEFLTVPTGEIFRLLCDHSVLVRDRATPISHQPREFERGLAEAGKHPGVPLLHRLFQSRSLRLDAQLTADGAPSWTSGLLIGTDCAGALPLFDDAEPSITLVAAPALADLYAAALTRLGRPSIRVSGDDAAFAGLARIQAALAGG
ncbi:MAG TPA: 2-dehydro-3-deoxygalactonokinase [Steroidobacteraceae bacterium]|nr:2-dehydro-3-deoxygalactonokinase [Steroidobacteraceae bacterium]